MDVCASASSTQFSQSLTSRAKFITPLHARDARFSRDAFLIDECVRRIVSPRIWSALVIDVVLVALELTIDERCGDATLVRQSRRVVR
jgi:hypothetical protein